MVLVVQLRCTVLKPTYPLTSMRSLAAPCVKLVCLNVGSVCMECFLQALHAVARRAVPEKYN